MTYNSASRIALVSLLALGAQLLPALSSAASFTDVPKTSTYYDAVSGLEEKGVIDGYEDGTYKPNDTINRAEFLKIVLEARGSTDFSGSNCFPDVHGEWFAKYVCSAKDEEIIGGYPDGTFKPDEPVSFVEAGKILTLAFKEQTGAGSEWYEPYARALEESKAIPTTIDSLDKKLTRGEMAEMMWRLKEGITTRPSKGYLNVKYPKMEINTSSDNVQTARSCEDLRAFTEEAQSAGSGPALYNRMEGDAIAPPMAAQSAEKAQDTSYSQTNVQVEGVDEADIVKTDGDYIYSLSNASVRIVKAIPATNLEETAVIDFSDEGFSPANLYVDGDTLVVIGSTWNNGGVHTMEKMMVPSIWPGYWGMNKSQVRLYDISNRAKPTMKRSVTFDGNVTSSRRIDDKLYVIMNQSPMYWGGPIPLAANAKEANLLPTYSDSSMNVTDQPVTTCAKVSILPHVPSPQYLMVGVIPVDNTKQKVQTEVILGSSENVYASLENLYVATTQWNYVWDSANADSTQKTNVFRFAYTSDGVDMQAQGSVKGRILNQFSMDEHDGDFRIATTVDQQWKSEHETIPSSNNLYVLNSDLKQIGEVENIAPGESIHSVRFMGDRAYMVTFKQIDPLFVIDVSNPRDPAILGKLKIPGYSDYLHPYDETHLIGFGKDVDETIDADKVHSDDAVYYTAVLGMKVALFNVSDVAHPKEMYKVVIGDRGTESPVLYDHKALLFEKDRNLLAFPVSVMELPEGAKPTDASAYPTQTFQGAYVYDLTLKDGFKKIGDISQYTQDEIEKSGSYLYGKNVERVLRIGENLYTTSANGVQSNALSTMKKLDTVTYGNNPVKDVIYPPETIR